MTSKMIPDEVVAWVSAAIGHSRKAASATPMSLIDFGYKLDREWPKQKLFNEALKQRFYPFLRIYFGRAPHKIVDTAVEAITPEGDQLDILDHLALTYRRIFRLGRPSYEADANAEDHQGRLRVIRRAVEVVARMGGSTDIIDHILDKTLPIIGAKYRDGRLGDRWGDPSWEPQGYDADRCKPTKDEITEAFAASLTGPPAAFKHLFDMHGFHLTDEPLHYALQTSRSPLTDNLSYYDVSTIRLALSVLNEHLRELEDYTPWYSDENGMRWSAKKLAIVVYPVKDGGTGESINETVIKKALELSKAGLEAMELVFRKADKDDDLFALDLMQRCLESFDVSSLDNLMSRIGIKRKPSKVKLHFTVEFKGLQLREGAKEKVHHVSVPETNYVYEFLEAAMSKTPILSGLSSNDASLRGTLSSQQFILRDRKLEAALSEFKNSKENPWVVEVSSADRTDRKLPEGYETQPKPKLPDDVPADVLKSLKSQLLFE